MSYGAEYSAKEKGEKPMGMFSKPKVYDLCLLTDEQLFHLINFFKNGWAEETRRLIHKQTLFSHRLDKEIVKSLQKRMLLEDEMKIVMEILYADLRFHPDDREEICIIEALERCPLV